MLTNTDGAGTSQWQAPATQGGTSLTFGGAFIVTASVAINGIANVMHTTRALTVDNCYAAWAAMGVGCSGGFPDISIYDVTASAVICAATGDNTGNLGVSETVVTSAIPSGHTVIVRPGLSPTSCAAGYDSFSIGMTYH